MTFQEFQVLDNFEFQMQAYNKVCLLFCLFVFKWECLNSESQTRPSNKTAKLSSPRLQSNFQFMCEGHRTCKVHTSESLVATWGGTGSQALCQPQAPTAGVN